MKRILPLLGALIFAAAAHAAGPTVQGPTVFKGALNLQGGVDCAPYASGYAALCFNPTADLLELHVGNKTISSAGSIPDATTYYIAPATLSSCRYDGDGSATACTPSDSNDGLSRAAPFATPAKLAATINGKVMLGLVTVKFARTTGGSCYSPDAVVLSPIPNGLGTPLYSLDNQYNPPAYPSSLLYLVGDTASPANVKLVGAASCAGTTAVNVAGFIFKGTNARVRGFEGDYYGGNQQFGVFTAIQSTLFAEDLRGTTDDGQSFNSALVAGINHSTIWPGGPNWGAIRNYLIVSLAGYSQWYYSSALGVPTFSWSGANYAAAFYVETSGEIEIFYINGSFAFDTGNGYLVYANASHVNLFLQGSISGGGYLVTGTRNSRVQVTTNDELTINSPLMDVLNANNSSVEMHCGGSCTFTVPVANRADVGGTGVATYDDVCGSHVSGGTGHLFFGGGSSINCFDANNSYVTLFPSLLALLPRYVTFGGISQSALAVGPLVPIATYAPPADAVPVHGGISGIVITPGTCTACGVDDHTFRLTDGTHNHDCESGARGTASPILCTAPAGTKIYCPTQADPNWSANSLISLQAISNTGTCTTPPIFQLTADLLIK